MAVKISKLFWWTGGIKKVVLTPFWWVIVMGIVFWVPVLRVWWWVFAPVLLSIELRILYLWWINWDYNYANKKWVMLEIVPPKETLVPLKAMEDVFTILWGTLYNPPNWREQWCEGVPEHNPDWMSFEIVSIEGSLHFYARVQSGHRLALETALYGQYPELEIHETADYTKTVPHNIPNAEWDVYGEDFILGRMAAYPIKTYEKFFEPQGEKMVAEEKRLDPINSLLELMSDLGQGEQFWLQFIFTTLSDDDPPPWRSEGQKLVKKLARRGEEKVVTLSEDLLATLSNLILGPRKEGSGEKATYKWLEPAVSVDADRELLLTSMERETLTDIETKLRKPSFRTNIRGVYVAKRENFKNSHKVLTRAYFGHFYTEKLNYIRFSPVTRPKTQYVFRKSIPLLRARRMFRNYILRFAPLFPDRVQEQAILNTEEMASIFHFPLKITGLISPTMARVESKKGGPPPNLPVE